MLLLGNLKWPVGPVTCCSQSLEPALPGMSCPQVTYPRASETPEPQQWHFGSRRGGRPGPRVTFQPLLARPLRCPGLRFPPSLAQLRTHLNSSDRHPGGADRCQPLTDAAADTPALVQPSPAIETSPWSCWSEWSHRSLLSQSLAKEKKKPGLAYGTNSSPGAYPGVLDQITTSYLNKTMVL